MKKWLVKYIEKTPMGMSSQRVATDEVWAKTARGAIGQVKREYREAFGDYENYGIVEIVSCEECN